MTRKSLKKTETERERKRERDRERQTDRLGVHREICFQLVFSRGFLPARISIRVLDTHSCTLGRLQLIWRSTLLTLVQERCPFMVARNVAGWWRRSLPSLAKELASETDS
jgi:hypothetical protein